MEALFIFALLLNVYVSNPLQLSFTGKSHFNKFESTFQVLYKIPISCSFLILIIQFTHSNIGL